MVAVAHCLGHSRTTFIIGDVQVGFQFDQKIDDLLFAAPGGVDDRGASGGVIALQIGTARQRVAVAPLTARHAHMAPDSGCVLATVDNEIMAFGLATDCLVNGVLEQAVILTGAQGGT